MYNNSAPDCTIMVSASEEDGNGNGGSMADEIAGDFYSEYDCVEELGRGLSSGRGRESWLRGCQ